MRVLRAASRFAYGGLTAAVAFTAFTLITAGCSRPLERAEPVPDTPPAMGAPILEIRTPREDALLDAERIVVEPETLRLEVGERTPFRVQVVDREGAVLHGIAPRATGVETLIELRDGEVLGLRAGRGMLLLEVPAPAGIRREPLRVRVPVHVVEATGNSPSGYEATENEAAENEAAENEAAGMR